MKSNSNTSIGFVGLLTIAFIVLKLLGKITWSWLWVLSPVWITAVISVILIGIVFLAVLYKEK